MPQLFTYPILDSSFFSEFDSDCSFEVSELKYEKDIAEDLKPFYFHEGNSTAHFYLHQINEKTIRIFYKAVPDDYTDNPNHFLCVLENTPGTINFHRLNKFNHISLDSNNTKNNILIRGEKKVYSFYVFDQLLNDENKIIYRAIHRNHDETSKNRKETERIDLSESTDLITWKFKKTLFTRKNWIDSCCPGLDTLSVIVYNPFSNLYIFYTRLNITWGQRHIQYSTSKDLENWSDFKEITIKNTPNYNIYTPFISLYPNSSIYLGFFPTLIKNNHNTLNSMFMYSPNGIDWSLHSSHKQKPLVPNLPAHLFAQGIGVLKNKFYFFLFKHRKEFNLSCYSVDRDRLFYLNCPGYHKLKTKPFQMADSKLYLNFLTDVDGYIKVKLYDNKQIIGSSTFLNGNHIKFLVDLYVSIIPSNKYSLEFEIYKSKLFSFSYYI